VADTARYLLAHQQSKTRGYCGRGDNAGWPTVADVATHEYQELVDLRTNSDLSPMEPVASGLTSAAWAGQIRDAIASGDAAVRGRDPDRAIIFARPV